jgi:murein DD-endopeptidase MepM/ murein hydrolase activator NlpD
MPGPAVYRVRRGDNLYRIGLAHGMTTQEIARLNGLRPPYEIHPGQELRVRGEVRRVAQAPRGSTPAPDNRSWTPPSPTPTPQPPAPAPAPAAQASFEWPLNGPIIGRFGDQQGQRLNGIRIQARVGEPVRAAAAGEVVYAGNELQGYGELILIRHEGRWVTAYGLNTEILVQEGQRVTAGQHIANAGGAGGGETPALHFEIRRGVTPVNPEQQLPPR